MDIFNYLGGMTAAAKFFGVSPQVVGNWRSRNGGLPKSWQMTAIEMGVPPHIVRPDLFKVTPPEEGGEMKRFDTGNQGCE